MDEIQFTRDLLVNNKELQYAGLFKIDEIYANINKAVESRGYVQREKRSEELVTEGGKKIYLELRPYKYITPEIKLLIKIKVALDNLTEIKKNNEKFQRGDVKIALDAWYMTNYKKRWMMKPWVYFAKAVIGKFIYQWPEEKNSRGQLVSDAAFVYASVKKLFKSYQPEAKKHLSEEEVIREAGKEIGK